MEKAKFIWKDGEFVDWDKAEIHVLSHCLHYGSGVFEGIRAYQTDKGPAVFRLEEHAKRLMDSFSIFGIEPPYSQEEIEKAILELMKKNGLGDAYIRPIIFFGRGQIGLKNLEKCNVNTVIAAGAWPKYLEGEAIKVKTTDIKRLSPKAFKVEAKVCGYYVNSILASREAAKDGYDEALMLDQEGNVAEGPGENIFIVKDGKLFTPPSGAILPGITRETIIKIAKDKGYEIEEKELELEEVKDADEVFMVGTAAEVAPISKIDDKEIGVGEIAKELEETYEKVVRGKEKEYEDWLTYVNPEAEVKNG